MKTTRSLSFYVAIWMAVAIGLSMATYALYERQTSPSLTWSELAVQHLGHVLGLGVMIYILCWGVFYFVLLRPLNRIYLHLYAVGAGQLKSLELDSNVREIRTIVDGINLMLSRLKLGADRDALEHAQQCIAEIRGMSRRLAITEQEHISHVLDKLADDLEKSLPSILVRRGMPPPTPAGTATSFSSLAVEDDERSAPHGENAGEL
ncbi:MAG: hypothetical protein ABS95_02745 [Verrucomicrobia bacterium SCN 57-15]|nr:MAG: hypothetical protein ABS95_02745 [Verrucomicrobia bacterium SCN 57-15]